MTGQLQLTPAGGSEQPVLFSIDLPNGLIWKVRGLSAAARVELATRAPEVLQDLVAVIAHQDEISDNELDHRLNGLRRDLDRLERLRATRAARRNQCPECGVHHKRGHADGCSRAPLGPAPLDPIP